MTAEQPFYVDCFVPGESKFPVDTFECKTFAEARECQRELMATGEFAKVQIGEETRGCAPQTWESTK